MQFLFGLLNFWGLLKKLGGIGLILMGLLDSSVIPTPGGMDVLLVLLATGEKKWWPYYAGMAVIGSVIGGYLTYRLGRKGGQDMLEQKLSKRKVERVCGAFEKWGFGAVLVPSLMPPPVPLGPFLLAAGVMDYPLKKFLLALIAGRMVRFAAVGYLASRFGGWVLRLFARRYVTILVVFIAMAIAGGVAFLIYRWHQKKKTPEAA